MGQLNLPTHGRIYVDSPVIIYSVEHVEPYTTLLDPLWLHVETGRCSVVCSELVVLETLVKPMREGNSALVMQFRSVLDASDISLVPATRPLWEESARLRALTGLKTPTRFMRQRPLARAAFFLSRTIATFDALQTCRSSFWMISSKRSIEPDACYSLTDCIGVDSGFRGNVGKGRFANSPPYGEGEDGSPHPRGQRRGSFHPHPNLPPSRGKGWWLGV